MRKEKFTYDHMEFEIEELGHCTIINLAGEHRRMLMHTLPIDLTVDQAKLLMQGYKAGLHDGSYRVQSAASRARENWGDLNRLFHFGERKND